MTTGLRTVGLIDLYDRTMLNGGFTLVRNGNGDLRIAEPQGYAVGVTTLQAKIDMAAPYAEFLAAIEAVQDAHPDANGIGGWMCAARHIHLDPITVESDLDAAIDLGHLHHQAAIFDLAADEEIVLDSAEV